MYRCRLQEPLMIGLTLLQRLGKTFPHWLGKTFPLWLGIKRSFHSDWIRPFHSDWVKAFHSDWVRPFHSDWHNDWRTSAYQCVSYIITSVGPYSDIIILCISYKHFLLNFRSESYSHTNSNLLINFQLKKQSTPGKEIVWDRLKCFAILTITLLQYILDFWENTTFLVLHTLYL